jgi:polyphosphate kinase
MNTPLTTGQTASKYADEPLLAPDNYLNRELSLVAFNRRVLHQALDTSTPLLERLKFLCISCSNLDEFFEVRVASTRQQLVLSADSTSLDGRSPARTLSDTREEVLNLVDEQYHVLNQVLIPALEAQGIAFLRRAEWNRRQRNWLEQYFQDELLPVLSPLGLDPAHPFPRILNKSLNFAVVLDGRDAFGREADMALVRAPRSLPRLIQLPSEISDQPHAFVFLSSVIHAFVDRLFPGMNVRGCHQFRVTRNSELFVDEEEVDNLARALQGELLERGFAEAVRLEVAETCPGSIAKFLLSRFNLDNDSLYRCNGPVNLNRLLELPQRIDRPDLKYPPFAPRVQAMVTSGADLFAMLRQGDVMLHHPFDSFATVVDFLRSAARDPNVLAIKQTLYRTDSDATMAQLLIEAARAGKDVTAVVELRARFDEEANISISGRLQEAGVQVVYGVVGHKTHAKMLLVVRRERDGLRRYVHLGTGNYHSGTSRLYTDYGMLSCDETIGEDVHKMFQQLSGLGPVIHLTRLLQSPFTLHAGMLERIRRETHHAQDGRPGKIIAKMNSLTEREVIAAMYEASNAGVQIELIIRGACCLRPGVAGLSENIRVRSVIGRFLEHTRVYWFLNDDDSETWLSSADWMDRNFFRRVESCFPVLDEKLAQRVFDESLANYLADNSQAWLLESDGNYVPVHRPEGQATHCAQLELLQPLLN